MRVCAFALAVATIGCFPRPPGAPNPAEPTLDVEEPWADPERERPTGTTPTAIDRESARVNAAARTIVIRGATILTALPAMLLASWLVARAFPLRPRIAGALYGLGAGLMADAGWRLFCHFSVPSHVFGAHTLAILATCGLGVVTASLFSRRR